MLKHCEIKIVRFTDPLSFLRICYLLRYDLCDNIDNGKCVQIVHLMIKNDLSHSRDNPLTVTGKVGNL